MLTQKNKTTDMKKEPLQLTDKRECGRKTINLFRVYPQIDKSFL